MPTKAESIRIQNNTMADTDRSSAKKKGKGLLFNVDSLRKSPPGMDGTAYFQQSPRCVTLPPRLSSLGRYCWPQYPVRLPPSTE